MRNITIISILFAVLAFSSCRTKLIHIGTLNMAANRNVHPNMEYVQISAYQNSDPKLLKRSRAVNLQNAIDDVVRKVPSGEFLTNVKIYQVVSRKNVYYAVEGDVWGNKPASAPAVKSIAVGDRVQQGNRQGTVMSLLDDMECVVQFDGETLGKRVKYSELLRVNR